MLKDNVYINPSLCDTSLHLKLVSFFLLFQDIANRNSNQMGVGSGKIVDSAWDWIITRVSVEFLRPVRMDEYVDLYTYPAGSKAGCIFIRNAGMRDKDNNLVVKLTSLWCVMDHKTRQIVMKPGFKSFEEDYGENMPFPEKLSQETASFAYKRTIRYSDCDMNGHLNNTRYVESIVDVSPLSFFEKHYVSKITINFLSEVYDGEDLELYSNLDNTYIEGRVGDRISFTAKLEYKAY